MGLPAIVKWTPRDEQVVGLHIAGMPSGQIAKKLSLTPGRISQILHDPKAVRLITQATRAIRARMQEDIEDNLVLMAEQSAKRLAETLDAEFLVGSKQKAGQDSVAISVLRGTGFLNKDFSGQEATEQSPLDRELSKRLISALENANEADAIRESAKEIIVDAIDLEAAAEELPHG